jgi:hypothetical protein
MGQGRATVARLLADSRIGASTAVSMPEPYRSTEIDRTDLPVVSTGSPFVPAAGKRIALPAGIASRRVKALRELNFFNGSANVWKVWLLNVGLELEALGGVREAADRHKNGETYLQKIAIA